MTKIKNTKKGMAKKTLSVSLAVAMLATSNVPVWAAEFSDGAEAPVVIAEEATEAFSDVTEAANDAPAAISEEAPAAEDSSISTPKTTLAISESGWANDIDIAGAVYDGDGLVVNNYAYAWVVDGVININNVGLTSTGTAGIAPYEPSENDIGKTVVLRIYSNLADAKVGNNFYVAQTNEVKISKANVELNSNGRLFDHKDAPNHAITYNGQSRYVNVTNISNMNLWVGFDNEDLHIEDFDYTCNLKNGDGISAGSVYVVTATPKDQSLYTGTLNYDYKVVEKDFVLGDLELTLTKSYEYTGNRIVPSASDIKVVDKLSGKTLNSEEVIASVESTSGTVSEIGTEQHGAIVKLHNVPNYTDGITYWVFNHTNSKDLLYTVVPRDLSNVDIVVDTIAYTGKVLTDNDSRFNNKLHFFDKTTGEELTLIKGTDYNIHVSGMPSDGTKDYTVEIKAKGGNTENWQSVSFTLGNETFEQQGYKLTAESLAYLQSNVAYTGENAVKDASKVVFMKGGDRLSSENYEVIVSGKDAGKRAGKVVIKGLKSYAGCEEVYYFDIDAAEVKDGDVTVAAKVIFNKGYTDASQYAPAVTVKANTAGTSDKKFTLTADDIKVSYSFDTTNMINEKITTTVQILNKNFKGGKVVFTLDGATLIAKRDLSKCTATVEPGSYVYTGAVVKPILKVMDGNEPLTEGVDYKIDEYISAKDVGTATVILRGIGDNANPAQGIYDTETTLSVNYEITPANAADVKVEFAEGNTETVYTGNVIKPTIFKVTLNGNDVSKQFDYYYPDTNVNVGTGHVILKPVTGNKNFTGTKDAEFQITARKLEGELKVYDEKGHEYIVNGQNGYLYEVVSTGNTPDLRRVRFAYDGTAHTFARAEFTPTGDFAKFVTADDYEIIYIDNVYGTASKGDPGILGDEGNGDAYIAVIGKGNFAGTQEITDSSEEVFKVVEGAAHKFRIEKYELKKQHVTIEDGEYAAGQPVRPNVTVTVDGKALVENQDYKLIYTSMSDLTNGKTMTVKVTGINGYKGEVFGTWGVVKKSMSNTQIVVGKGTKPSITVYNSGVVVPASEYTVEYGKDNITVTANTASKYYTGSAVVDYVDERPDAKPATPVITGVKVVGNKATVEMAGECTGATGYDFVISTVNNTADGRVAVNKNRVGTSTDFTYVDQGVYYAYVHAWKRGEDGKKIFSDWSNVMPFAVTAITPEQPAVPSVTVKGSTVTVTFTQTPNAIGYDVVLGTSMKKVYGENRPVNYGTLVKKNITGNKVTAVFKDVPKGTYYAALHSYNRTSEDGKKVFSRWSNAKKVTVK